MGDRGECQIILPPPKRQLIPSIQDQEELSNRFLSKRDYERALHDLVDGVPLTDMTAVELLNTVRALDLLELIALLLQADCILDTDFIHLGLILARSSTKKCFAYGLGQIINTAGTIKVRAESVEDISRTIVRTAGEQIKSNPYTREMVTDLYVRQVYSILI